MIGAIAAGVLAVASAGAAPADLSGSFTLLQLLEEARARNPDLAEARSRAEAAQGRAHAAGRYPDLEVKGELWGVPLRRPYAVGDADTIMIGLRQSIPPLGTVELRARAGDEEAEVSALALGVRGLEIEVQVRRAFVDLWRAERALELRLEHAELAERTLELGRVGYQTGHATQRDVLRLSVELSRVHVAHEASTQQRDSARALLNALLGRHPDAPLGTPVLPPPPSLEIREGIGPRSSAVRPELAAAGHVIRQAEARLEEARRAARWPSFMVGLDYWYMPTREMHHAYGAMVAMSLPWLNLRHRDEEREAEATLAAQHQALASATFALEYQARDALLRRAAAAAALSRIVKELVPLAGESYEAALASFTTGQGDALGVLDALRTLIDVRSEQIEAQSRLFLSDADLRRAVGGGSETDGGAPR